MGRADDADTHTAGWKELDDLVVLGSQPWAEQLSEGRGRRSGCGGAGEGRAAAATAHLWGGHVEQRGRAGQAVTGCEVLLVRAGGEVGERRAVSEDGRVGLYLAENFGRQRGHGEIALSIVIGSSNR